MTAITIATLVTDKLPQTEYELLAKTEIDWLNAKARAIAMEKIAIYGVEQAESSISDQRILNFIADRAVIRLIDFAVDYYQRATRLRDTKLDATYQYYDLVENLSERRKELVDQTAAERPMIMDIVEDEVYGTSTKAKGAQIGISTITSGLATPDPWARARVR